MTFNQIISSSIGRLVSVILGIVLLFFIASLLIRGCADTPAVVTHHENNKEKINYKDSLQTALYIRERKFQDSIVSTLGERITKVETIYKEADNRDKQIEYVYLDKPTLENCNEVAKSKNNVITLLKSKDSLEVARNKELRNTIVLLDTVVVQKNRTILALNTGYDNAIRDLSKATKKRPVAITVGPNYSVSTDGRIRPGVGVQIGFKLAQF